jgi:two-component system chemotaxis response regulator CheB
MEPRKIRVLVVEDSMVVQMYMVHLLKSDPCFEVIGTAGDGEEAVAFVNRDKPDVILMDVHMPRMDGIEATRRIMETDPVPIVMASATIKSEEVPLTFQALEAGALAFVDKSARPGTPQSDEALKQLKQTLKLMSEVKVVRRWPRAQVAKRAARQRAAATKSVRLVAIGASTGGPSVLQTIFAGLPEDVPWPILVVQHIACGFLPGLAEWLTQTAGVPSRIAVDGETPQAGHAYLAPDDFHMGLDRRGRISLSKAAPEGGLRPSVGHLFRSVADSAGEQAIGILLTGMGKDGAEELKLLKDRGAMTIVQDKESSVVHGMPGEAIRLGAATHILGPEEIAAVLTKFVAP